MKAESRSGIVPWLLGMSVGRLSLLLVALTFVLYGQTLFHGYNMDDELVTRNHRFTSQGIEAIPDIFKSPYYEDDMGYSYEYRPVVHISFAIEHQIFGESPRVSHLVNLLIFAFTGVLVFLLVKRIFPGLGMTFPLLTAVIFVVHPIHTEAVCSIKNREELLALLGGLAACLCLMRYLSTMKPHWLLLMTLALALGLLSKLSAISFTVIIPFIAVYASQRFLQSLVVLFSCTALLGVVLFLRSGSIAYAIVLSGTLAAVMSVMWAVFQLREQYVRLAAGVIRGRDRLLTHTRELLTGNLAMYQTKRHDIVSLAQLLVPVALLLVIGIIHGSGWPILIASLILLLHPLVFASFNMTVQTVALMVLGFMVMPIIPVNLDFFMVYCVGLLNMAYYLWGRSMSLWQLTILQTIWILSVQGYVLLQQDDPLEVFPSFVLLGIVHAPLLLSDDGRKGRIFKAMPLFLLLFFAIEVVVGDGVPYDSLAVILLYAGITNMPDKRTLRRPLMMVLMVLPVLPSIVAHVFQTTGQHSMLKEEGMNRPDIVSGAAAKPPTGQTEDRPLTYVEFPLGFDSSMEERLATSVVVLGHYIRQMALGGPQAFYYGYQHFDRTDLSDPKALLFLSILIVLVMLIVIMLYKRSPGALGLLMFLSSIMVFSNLFEPVAGMAGDRLTYISSFGFCIALGHALSALYMKMRTPFALRMVAVGITLLLVTWSGMTVARAAKWKDALTLMRHDIHTVPNSAQAHNLLASNLMKYSFEPEYARQAIEMRLEAIEHFKQAVRIWPEFFNVWYDLGRSYMTVNKPDLALPAYKEAHRLDSTFYDATINVAVISEQRGNVKQAVEYYERCIRFNPDMLEPYGNLSYLLFREGRFEESIAVNERAIVQNPSWTDPYLNIARTYDVMGKADKAEEYRARVPK